jgi:hypothetical protein
MAVLEELVQVEWVRLKGGARHSDRSRLPAGAASGHGARRPEGNPLRRGRISAPPLASLHCKPLRVRPQIRAIGNDSGLFE